MRGFLVRELAHPSKITLSLDVSLGKPSSNDVIIDVYAAGMNFFDILQAQGKYQNQPKLPFVLGAEFAGKIAEDSPIPTGCSFKLGQRVFGATQGAYAERCLADHRRLVPLPDELSYEEGAGNVHIVIGSQAYLTGAQGLYVTFPTAYEGIVGRAGVRKGDWVLVTAAAGGVGLPAVQIAKSLGAKVIAAGGSQSKLDVAKKYGGADYTLDYNKPDWQKEVMRITAGKGVDVIYDPVGMIRGCLKCIAWKGRAVVVGFAGGEIEKLSLNLVLLKNISVVGLHWGKYTEAEPTRVAEVWAKLLDMLTRKEVTPIVYPTLYRLTDVSRGLDDIQARKTWGKAIVQVKSAENPRSHAKL